jgi:hypothetical protein
MNNLPWVIVIITRGIIMKTWKYVLVLCAFMSLVFSQGNAVAGFYTGNDLVKDMREYDKKEAGASDFSPVGAAYFVGYITGVSDASVLFNAPRYMTVRRVCDIVAKYLKDHPEQWAEPASDIVIKALEEAYHQPISDPKGKIPQFPPLEGYPRSSLPPIDKTIIPPPPQSPMRSPPVPENRGAFNPQTGERYLPSGNGVYNPNTGEYYPPSGNGYINTRNGEYYPRVDN